MSHAERPGHAWRVPASLGPCSSEAPLRRRETPLHPQLGLAGPAAAGRRKRGPGPVDSESGSMRAEPPPGEGTADDGGQEVARGFLTSPDPSTDHTQDLVACDVNCQARLAPRVAASRLTMPVT